MSEILSICRSLKAFLKGMKSNLRPEVLKPDIRARSVAHIDSNRLRKKGITHIFLDMDNTITGFHGRHVDKRVERKLLELCKGFRAYILSNSDEEHIKGFLARNKRFILHYIPLRGRKKPDIDTYRYVIKRSGARAKDCAMVGDRYFTDIAGAKKAGFGLVIKIPPLLPSTEPVILRLAREVERAYVKIRKIR